MRILVIDDEPSVRELFAVALGRKGHEVDTAADGAEALERLVVGKYDAVFLDIVLGVGMDGFEVFDEIRRLGLGGRVILMTGRPSDEKLIRYAEQADAFLKKPIQGLHHILTAVDG